MSKTVNASIWHRARIGKYRTDLEVAEVTLEEHQLPLLAHLVEMLERPTDAQPTHVLTRDSKAQGLVIRSMALSQNNQLLHYQVGLLVPQRFKLHWSSQLWVDEEVDFHQPINIGKARIHA